MFGNTAVVNNYIAELQNFMCTPRILFVMLVNKFASQHLRVPTPYVNKLRPYISLIVKAYVIAWFYSRRVAK